MKWPGPVHFHVISLLPFTGRQPKEGKGNYDYGLLGEPEARGCYSQQLPP